VGFVVGWCFSEPIARYLDDALAFGVAGVVEVFVVILEPTASVATSVTMCLWRDEVGGTAGDSVGGRLVGCG